LIKIVAPGTRKGVIIPHTPLRTEEYSWLKEGIRNTGLTLHPDPTWSLETVEFPIILANLLPGISGKYVQGHIMQVAKKVTDQ
jgi:hypothetical protein